MKNEKFNENIYQEYLDYCKSDERTPKGINKLKNELYKHIKKFHTKGKILTVGELKKLPKYSIIYLIYEGYEKEEGFEIFSGFDGVNTELTTESCYTMPIDGYEDEELIDRFENDVYNFTVREAIKKVIE
jgi:excinuclease UvrABC helicase subunit UvrB